MFYFTGTRKPNFKDIKKIDYDDYWKERGFSINKKLKEREQIMFSAIPKGSRVLDVGCGNSLLPIVLKNNGCLVSVADISDIVLNEFKKLSIGTVNIDLDKISEQKISDEYDYIILSEVLEHTRNPEEILLTLAPHTKYFFLTIPNSAFYRYRLHLFFFGRFFTQWVYHPSEHLRYWSHIDFIDWVKALGFEVVWAESSNGLSFFGLPLLKWFPNLFGHQICYLVKKIK
jgi:methionine biosynthesis protein MetW